MAFTTCLILPGCGGDDRVDVRGTVSVDGVPVEKGSILFRPADGKGPTAEAAIDQGAYAVSLRTGEKQVVIEGFQVTGEQHPWGPDAPAAPILEPVVPKKFGANSPLTIDIEQDDASLDFPLTTE